MRLKDGFITHRVMDRQVMVAVGDAAKQFSGLVQANDTAAFIVDRLKSETSEGAIVDALLDEYDTDRATAEADVRRIIDRLREIGAIEE